MLSRGRFGQRGTRMGSLTAGTRLQVNPSGRPTWITIHTPPVVVDLLPIGDELPASERVAREFENRRRERAQRIRDQLNMFKAEAKSKVTAQSGIALIGQVIQRPPDPPPETPLCARFSEIQDYLFTNRLELALDTLNFKMPEHVMYSHILRNGGLDITADEWRSFLEVCEYRKILFKYLHFLQFLDSSLKLGAHFNFL